MPHLREMHDTTRAVLLAALLLVFGLLFHQLVTLMVAVLITVLFSIPLSAGAGRLERRGVPRVVGTIVTLFAGVVVLAGVLALIIPSFVEQTETFVDEVPAIVDSLEEQIGGAINANPGEVGDSLQSTLQTYTDDPGNLVGPVASFGLGLAGFLGGLLVIVLTATYIAINPQPLVDGTVKLLPPRRRAWALDVMERLRESWVGWMQGVLIDMLVSGILFYIGLTLIGLDFAIVFAVFSALLVVIPYFGAIAGGIPPVLYALTDSPGKALLVLVIYLIVQQVESNLTIPLVMAQRVKLHPAVVAIGVVIVGQLFGFIGLFVAVPILSLVVIAVDELWVQPLEAEKGVVAASDATAPSSGELELPPGAGEEPPTRVERVRSG